MADKSNELFEKVRSSKNGKELADYLKGKLNAEQSKRLKSLLGDENAVKRLLNTPRAKEIIKKITEEGNGQHK